MQPASFPFGKEVQRYQQAEVVTPYHKLGQKYDKPIGDAVYKAYIWRVIFFWASGVSFLLSLILIAYLNALPSRILVEQVTDKGFLKSPPVFLSPSYNMSADVLKHFVHWLMIGSLKNNNYNDFVDEKSLNALKQKLLGLKSEKLKNATFNQFNMVGDNFTGELVDANGKVILAITGKFKHQAPASKQEVKINPLGIYIDNLSIQRL